MYRSSERGKHGRFAVFLERQDEQDDRMEQKEWLLELSDFIFARRVGNDARWAHFAEIAKGEKFGKKIIEPTSGPMGAI